MRFLTEPEAVIIVPCLHITCVPPSTHISRLQPSTPTVRRPYLSWPHDPGEGVAGAALRRLPEVGKRRVEGAVVSSVNGVIEAQHGDGDADGRAIHHRHQGLREVDEG